MNNIYIYQPLIPHYRVSFFNLLNNKLDGKLTVICNKTIPNDNSITTVSDGFDFKVVYSKCYSFLRHAIFWQSFGIPLKQYKKGDVIVISGNPRFLSNLFLIFFAKIKSIKIVWWGHYRTAGSKSSNQIIKRWLMRLVDHIIFYTKKEVSDFLIDGNKKNNVTGINNSIDNKKNESFINEWEPSTITKFKQENKLTNKTVFLFCGRITEKSNLILGLNAFKKLEKKKVLLVIIGDGPVLDELKTFCITKNMNNVIFKGAIYEESNLAPWFLSSDYFLYPGNIGLSLLHAFSYKLPVITHNKDRFQMPEFAALKDNYNGLKYKYNNVDDLIDKLKLVLDNKNLHNKMSNNAYKTVKEDFNLSNMVLNFYNALKNVS